MPPPCSARHLPLATALSSHSLSALSTSLSAAWQPCCPHQAELLPADAWAVSVSNIRALSSCSSLSLSSLPLSSSSSLPGIREEHSPLQFFMVQCRHGGCPSSLPGLPSGQGAHLPKQPPLRCVMSDWKSRARPGEDRGSGSFPGGQGGPASQGPAGSEAQLPIQPCGASACPEVEVCLETSPQHSGALPGCRRPPASGLGI